MTIEEIYAMGFCIMVLSGPAYCVLYGFICLFYPKLILKKTLPVPYAEGVCGYFVLSGMVGLFWPLAVIIGLIYGISLYCTWNVQKYKEEQEGIINDK